MDKSRVCELNNVKSKIVAITVLENPSFIGFDWLVFTSFLVIIKYVTMLFSIDMSKHKVNEFILPAKIKLNIMPPVKVPKVS